MIEALNIYREEQNKLDMYRQALSILTTKEEKDKVGVFAVPFRSSTNCTNMCTCNV